MGPHGNRQTIYLSLDSVAGLATASTRHFDNDCVIIGPDRVFGQGERPMTTSREYLMQGLRKGREEAWCAWRSKEKKRGGRWGCSENPNLDHDTVYFLYSRHIGRKAEEAAWAIESHALHVLGWGVGTDDQERGPRGWKDPS